MDLLDSKSICLKNLFLKTRCKTEPNEHAPRPSKEKFKISDLILIRAITSDKTLSDKLRPVKKVQSISELNVRNLSLPQKNRGESREKLAFLKFFHAKKAINTELRNHTVDYKNKRNISDQRVENTSSFSILASKKVPERRAKDCLNDFTLAEKDILLSHLKQAKEGFKKDTLPLANKKESGQAIIDAKKRINSRYLRKNKWVL